MRQSSQQNNSVTVTQCELIIKNKTQSIKYESSRR